MNYVYLLTGGSGTTTWHVAAFEDKDFAHQMKKRLNETSAIYGSPQKFEDCEEMAQQLRELGDGSPQPTIGWSLIYTVTPVLFIGKAVAK